MKEALKKTIIVFPALAFLTSCSGVPFSNEDFLNKLFGNFWSLVINLVALIVLFIAVFFIAYKPMRKYLEARKSHIEHEIKDAENSKKVYESKAAEGEKIVADAKKEAGEIVSKAKETATVSANAIINEAQEVSKKKMEDTEKAIALAEEKAKDDIKKAIVEVALQASEKVLEREVDEEDNSRLIDSFASDLEKGGNK